MEAIVRDLRFAVRNLARQRAFTATAIATLSLAIGVSAAIFTVVEATILRPLPFASPDRMVWMDGVAGPERSVRGASPVEVLDWARLNRVFEHVSIYDETSLNLRGEETTERVEAEMVSASYWPLMGARAQIGRVFTVDEDRVPSRDAVVTISDALWRSRFGADPGVIGRTLTFNDRPFTILGVMEPGFKGLSFDTDVWFPAMMAPANGGPANFESRGSRWVGALGTLRPGIELEDAQRDADRVALLLAAEHPESNTDRWVRVTGLRDSYLGTTDDMLLVVFAAVSLLLIIAAANVLGLQVVRAAARQREMALRLAIGADRRRLMQQLTVEGLVLSGASAALGTLLAYWGLDALRLLIPPGVLPAYATLGISLPTLGFALVVALLCGAVFGLIPALNAGRLDLSDSLRDGARGTSGSFGHARGGLRQLLVMGQAAIALVLLVGAGLFARSLQRELAVSPGFDPAEVLRVRLDFPSGLDAEARVSMAQRVHERLAAIPSVRDVALGSDVPLGGSSNASFIYDPAADERYRYYVHSVLPDFHAGLRIRLLAGRAIGDDDRRDAPGVALINESGARRLWGGEIGDAVGKRMRLGSAEGTEVTIVGVVSDVRYRDLRTSLATTEPDVYFPYLQRPSPYVQVAVRSSLPAENLTATVRREIALVSPLITVYAAQPMEAMLAAQTGNGRLASSLLMVFGAAALGLTAVGLYGVLAYLVALRHREIGIRLALGASRGAVVRAIMAHGFRLAVIGLTGGLVLAAMTTRWIASQLYGVGAHDPLVFLAVPVVLVLVALVASALPARRAANVDPQLALRAD